MDSTREPASGEQVGRLDANVRDMLLRDPEAFNLFYQEAKRRGVKLSLSDNSSSKHPLAVMKPQQFEKPVQSEPVRAVVRIEREPSASIDSNSVGEEIVRKLRWNPQDSNTAKNLASLLERIGAMGIEDPNSYLSLRDAAQKSGVAERTLRRYIADGQLETEKVKGPRGWEHRVYVPALFAVLQQKAGAFERAHSSPLEDMSREVATLCRAIVDQQQLSEARTNRLLDEMRNQMRVMDELRNEQREARHEMLVLQDCMTQYMNRAPRKSFWQRLFSSE